MFLHLFLLVFLSLELKEEKDNAIPAIIPMHIPVRSRHEARSIST